jgi:tetratricopeptide (TPR) repeat protein
MKSPTMHKRPSPSRRLLLFLSAGLSALSSCASHRSEAAVAPAKPAPVFEELGRHHHPITTRVPEAQRYFDQGLMLLFNFNHQEAIRSFRAAAALDPQSAMPHWGEAFAYGPHINAPMFDDAVAPAWAALQEALKRKPNASARERAYIDALAQRYVAPGAKQERAPLDAAFAEAMRGVADAFPDDHDASVFYVDALMNTMPWDYWQPDKQQPKPAIADALRRIDAVLARAPDHPGANHLNIHLVEAGPNPARALPSAARLRRYAPAAGHLVHMPSHIYIRVGQYQDAVDANNEAAKADRRYIAACQVQGFYPGAYYPHNLHFLWFAQLFQGRAADTLAAAQQVASYALTPLCGTPVVEKPRFTWLPLVTQLRFGRWNDVLAAAEPPADQPYDRAIWRYARTRAFAAKRDAGSAEKEAAALEQLAASDAVKAVDNPGFPATATLVVAKHLAHASVAAARGEHDKRLASLRAAVEAEHALPYMEPSFWWYPTRQTLAAALLETGRAAEAEKEFRADLIEFPRNGWSLFGLAHALRAQEKAEAAAFVEREFTQAWEKADVTLQLDWL